MTDPEADPHLHGAPSAPEAIEARAKAALLDAWTPRGAFVGELSTSALSTAVGSMALALGAAATPDPATRTRWRALAEGGWRWLAFHQNADGGYGDTTDSPSNVSTTLLAWVSLGLDRIRPSAAGAAAADHGAAEARAEAWLRRELGELAPAHLARSIRARYGKDQTFSVPILTTCALGGRLGEGRAAWKHVPALPFELAALPHRWFRWLDLRVVSYALPALIAIGQVRHHFRPGSPLTRPGRALTRRRTLELLREIQPDSGGYLEAAPLTGFVCMSLIAMGRVEHPVVQRGLGFLAQTVRGDGSWPIDTNLDTWCTTLAVRALGSEALGDERRRITTHWLLDQQYRTEHPFTRAAPGGWAWTDLSGGVPDGDDTPGALLALHELRAHADDAVRSRIDDAAAAGLRWLVDLQNRDGGMPTFCRGWGKLPFDRSSPDLTAHALRAFRAWGQGHDLDRPRARAIAYLLRTQQADGSWLPLWFGNQQHPDDENPLYGTARVLQALAGELHADGTVEGLPDAVRRAVRFVLSCRAGDGGFGAAPGLAPTIEETALAVSALAAITSTDPDPEFTEAIAAGRRALDRLTEGGRSFPAAPIGLYFARLWYRERLYPLVFAVEALRVAARHSPPTHPPPHPPT